MVQRFVGSISLLVTLLALLTTPSLGAALAPYYTAPVGYADTGFYLVVFKPGHTLEQHYDAVKEGRFLVTPFPIDDGYDAKLSDELREKVRTDPGVDFVEESAFGDPDDDSDDDNNCDSVNTGIIPESAHLESRATQSNPGWGLIYLSAAAKPVPGGEMNYEYLDDAGMGVYIYVIDSGVLSNSNEFGTRVREMFNESDEPWDDVGNHGTKVASIVGGAVHGVAKFANILSCKIRKQQRPDTLNLNRVLKRIKARHNLRKLDADFKGSIINMSFAVGSTLQTRRELEACYNAGISLVASAGNMGYQKGHFPSSHPNVISAGGMTNAYRPRRSSAQKGSNYGRDEVTVRAPGQAVNALDNQGQTTCVNGTSYASAYVSGILAIFFGYEKTTPTPDLARQRLVDNNAFPFMTFPSAINWRGSTSKLANTGFKRAKPLPYVGAPSVPPPASISAPRLAPPGSTPTSANSLPSPTAGCEPSNHNALKSFTVSQARSAASSFAEKCNGVEFRRGSKTGCTVRYQPCREDVNITMTLEYLSFKDDGGHSPNRQEVYDDPLAVVNNCDTTTTEEKWGGFWAFEDPDQGVKKYSVNGEKDYRDRPTDDKWSSFFIDACKNGDEQG